MHDAQGISFLTRISKCRLTLWYGTALALILIIFSTILYVITARSLRDAVDQSLEDLELDNVSTRKPLPESPVIRLDRCAGAIVRSSRAFAGTGTFLSAAPGELKSIVFEGNVTGNARKPRDEVKAEFWQALEPATEAEHAPGAAPAK